MRSQSQFVQLGRRTPPTAVVEVVLEYASALAVAAGFDHPARGWRMPPKDGRLWCMNDSAPIPPKLLGRIPLIHRDQREVIFGYRLPREACSVLKDTKRPFRGTFVRDDDGLAVAEVKGSACYLAFDLLAFPEETSALVLRKVLDAALASHGEALAASSKISEEARRLAVKTLLQRTMAVEANWARKKEHGTRDAFITVGRSHSTSRLSYLEAEIESLNENLAEFSRRITADSRRLVKYQRELGSLEGEELNDAVDFGDEYDRIRAYPLVHDLTVEDDRLVVTTIPLTTDYEEERINLGRFALEINLNGDVRITNLTRKLWDFDHPHIRDGNPCLGNIQDGVAKLIGAYQLAAATQVLIDFLQLVNPREWVVSVEFWREP